MFQYWDIPAIPFPVSTPGAPLLILFRLWFFLSMMPGGLESSSLWVAGIFENNKYINLVNTYKYNIYCKYICPTQPACWHMFPKKLIQTLIVAKCAKNTEHLPTASKKLLNLSTNSLMNLSCCCWSSPIILSHLRRVSLMTGVPWESNKVNKQFIESHNTTITIHLTNKSNMHHIFCLQPANPGSNYICQCPVNIYKWNTFIEKRGKDTKD